MSQCGDGRDRHHEKLFKDTTTRRGCQIIGLKWGANTPITSDTPLRAFHVLQAGASIHESKIAVSDDGHGAAGYKDPTATIAE